MKKLALLVAVLLAPLSARAVDPYKPWDARLLLAQAPAAAPQAQAQAAQAAIQANAPQTAALCHTFVCPVWEDWTHAQVSAQLLYAPARRMAFDGGSADLAILYNPAIGASWWPASWTAAGVAAPACAFLEAGGGGDSRSAFVHAGASCNVAPVLVGPAAKALTAAGGAYAAVGAVLVSPDGSGLKISGGIKADVVANGGLEAAKDVKGEAVIGVGYKWTFGRKAP